MQTIYISVLAATLCLPSLTGRGQESYSLQHLQKLAKEHHPLAKEKLLVRSNAEMSLQNLEKALLPAITVAGQASYQSTVTAIPIRIPGVEVPQLSRDQYRLYGELSQVLYDGGTIQAQKELLAGEGLAEEMKTEVDLYALMERVNMHFFRILLAQGQLRQAGLTEKDLEAELKKRTAAVEAGVALRSSVAQLKAELLRIRQKKTEIRAGMLSELQMLSHFTGKTLDETTTFTQPQIEEQQQLVISRPELSLFEQRSRLALVRKQAIAGRSRPRVSLFLQGGIGRPALNMLSNEFEPYYIGGLRLSWSLNGLYTIKKEKSMADISRTRIDLQKEIFLFNLGSALMQQDAELQKMSALLASDEEIIALRNEIKDAATAQLENGVISTTDYLREVNAAEQAQESKLIHLIQLLMLQQQRRILTGTNTIN